MVVFVIAGSDVKGGSKLALRGELHISPETVEVKLLLFCCLIISAASFG
jgi:hypothetical protein